MSTHDSSEDAFGFGALTNPSTKDKIKQIKPTPPASPVPDLAKIDQAADNVGFVSRERVLLPDYSYERARILRPEPRVALNMRVPESLGAVFQKFCKDNRYSYPEALEEIMKRAGMPTKPTHDM
jgi:hypothetical protein